MGAYRKDSFLRRLLPELRGGIAVGWISLLEAIPLGLIAFAPLGAAYFEVGILAAIYGSIIGTLLIALLGGTPGMISAPSTVSAPLFAFVLTASLHDPLTAGSPEQALALAFLTMILVGLLQLIMGVLRADFLVKFISYPVIAGLLMGLGYVILRSQLTVMLGLPPQTSFTELIERPGDIKLLNLAIGLLVILLYLMKERWKRGSLFFLAIPLLAALLHHLLIAAGVSASQLGPTVQPFKLATPTFDPLIAIYQLFVTHGPMSILLHLFPGALSAAAFLSLQTLLSALSYRNVAVENPQTARELIGQGCGNAVASCLGGLASTGVYGRSLISYYEGGRGRTSAALCALTVLVGALLLPSLIAYIPSVALAALIFTLGIRMIDPWTLRLIADLVRGRTKLTRQLAIDLAITAVVTAVIIAGHFFTAIGLGIAFSLLNFLSDTRRYSIQRIYESKSIRSKTERNKQVSALLEQHSSRLKVVEVNGALYFGSAEYLVDQIEGLEKAGADFIILDCRHAYSIDPTGLRLVELLYKRLQTKGKKLILTGIALGSSFQRQLANLRFMERHPDVKQFWDTDSAVGAIEEQLIKEHLPELTAAEQSIEASDLFDGLSPAQKEQITQQLTQAVYQPGESIISQGAEDDALFFLTRGTVDVYIHAASQDGIREKRVQSFSAGTFFGEMALLRQTARSASVVAISEAHCKLLSREAFKHIQSKHPEAAVILLTNLSRVLSHRLAFHVQQLSEGEV